MNYDQTRWKYKNRGFDSKGDYFSHAHLYVAYPDRVVEKTGMYLNHLGEKLKNIL